MQALNDGSYFLNSPPDAAADFFINDLANQLVMGMDRPKRSFFTDILRSTAGSLASLYERAGETLWPASIAEKREQSKDGLLSAATAVLKNSRTLAICEFPVAANGSTCTRLSQALHLCVSLQSLTLQRNQITILPDVHRMLTSLSQLSIIDNPRLVMPTWLEKLTGLTDLRLSNVGLYELPPELYPLRAQLTAINLSNNPIRTLPRWLEEFAKLRRLDLSKTSLPTGPDWSRRRDATFERPPWFNLFANAVLQHSPVPPPSPQILSARVNFERPTLTVLFWPGR